jgi:hypothetical protein
VCGLIAIAGMIVSAPLGIEASDKRDTYVVGKGMSCHARRVRHAFKFYGQKVKGVFLNTPIEPISA